MSFLRHFVLLGLAVGAMAVPTGAVEREENLWPFVVRQKDATGQIQAWTGAGPFLFKHPTLDQSGAPATISGFRPFWIQTKDPQGELRTGWALYPLFTYAADNDTYKWSVFELIRRTDRKAGGAPPNSVFDQSGEFDVWPFWFSRDTGNPELSYRALFPIAGTVKNRLGFERASWVLFPLYFQTEKRGAVTTATPWPFIRVTRGAAEGFALWPLFGWKNRAGVGHENFYLWPLGYDRTRAPGPDAPVGTPPRHDFGALPFYAKSTGPGFISEDYLWPFFGYTARTLPYRYQEKRYFWPFLVQGRGDDRMVNRWGPFYTHSILKGYDKKWIAWPFYRRATWTEAGLAQTKTQLLYFLYRSHEQRSVTNPKVPGAAIRHYWPLLSTWDNGAGRRQFQVLSPFEVFFPGNEKFRQTWAPFPALYRRDERASGETRTSVLWNGITWQRHDAEKRREFHLGPLLAVARDADSHRVSIGQGLFGWERRPGQRWRAFWLDFPAKEAKTKTAPR